jgi:hypothetical protein
MTVDLAIADDHNRQNAESAREPGPKAVPPSGFVEGAGPSEGVMEERIETVHQPPHFVMPSTLISTEPTKTDANSSPDHVNALREFVAAIE